MYGKIFGRIFLQDYLEQPNDSTPDTYTLSDIVESYSMWDSGFVSRLPPGSTSQLFTMFETSDVHPEIINEMKKFSRVIVPFDYLKNILEHHGVKTMSLNFFTSKLIRSKPKIVPKQKDPERLIFLYVGTNDIRKNVPALVETFIEFSKGTRHMLILKTNKSDDLIQSENVKIVTGRVPLEQMATLYNICDYVISFTHGEGVGMPMLEADYFGKPIICHDQGVFRDIKKFVNVPWHVLPAQEVPIDYTKVPDFLKKVFWGTWWEVDRLKALELLKSICV
jgi:glycosyltransferase involved in cell wall biosynthesis